LPAVTSSISVMEIWNHICSKTFYRHKAVRLISNAIVRDFLD